MMRENATNLKDRLQKDYDEHEIRTTGRTAVASSSRGRSAAQSVGSGASVQSGPTKSLATAQLGTPPLSTPSASSSVSNSGSMVAQLKAGAAPPKPPSNGSGSSEKAGSASGNVSSSGSKAAQLKAANLPPKPPSNVSASSGQARSAPENVDSSASKVAHLKAGTRPRKPSSTVSGSSGQAGSISGSSNNRRTDRYRDRDESPASLQRRRSDSPDRARPPPNYDQRPRDRARKVTYEDEETLDRDNRTPVKDTKKPINNGNASLRKTMKPPITDDKARPVRNPTKPPIIDDTRPNKDETVQTQDDKGSERNSVADSSNSSGKRALKKQTEPVERPVYKKSDEVYVPTNNSLYGRRW